MKIVVVDDSIVFRSSIVSALSTTPEITVERSLVNGKLAVDFLKQNPNIDLITLDMEMPVMDGMEAIREIRKFNKTVVIIVFSAYTQKGAEKTIEALNAGANDFVTKPEVAGGGSEDGIKAIKDDLLPKILAFKERLSLKKSFNEVKSLKTPSDLAGSPVSYQVNLPPQILLIGCSTGGPEALSQIFRAIKKNVNIPILIVQHMPPMFTQKLAEMLDKLSPIEVREAKEGDRLRPGLCLIAPGDFHMLVTKEGSIALTQSEKVCYVRPSVDVMFQSVFENFRGHTLAFILTGMGEDGAQGAKLLQNKSADIFIQDKETSVVWGMPGSVKKHVDTAKVIPLEDIAMVVQKFCS